MNPFDSLFGPCSMSNFGGEDYVFDLQSFVNKLLLFDRFILHSPNFREIPYIIQYFGFEGTLDLLYSGALRISCDWCFAGQVAQTDFLVQGGKPLPLGNYSILYAFSAERKKWVSDQLRKIAIPYLSHQQNKKLKLAIVAALEESSVQDSIVELQQQTDSDLMSNRGIKLATVISLREKGFQADLNDFSIQLHQIDEKIFRAENNLEHIFSMNEVDIHKTIERSILGVAALNQRIVEMKVYNSLSGFLSSEEPLYRDKLQFLIEACDPHKTEEKFERVFRLKNFPEVKFNPEQKVSVEKLLEVRKSKELMEYREWLKKNDTSSDSELVDQLNNLRSKLGGFIHSDSGKMTRLLLSTAAGFIPGANIITSLGLGVADSFVLEKLLPNSGVVAFVDDLYPSIFQPLKPNYF